jgi:hypothetical protein
MGETPMLRRMDDAAFITAFEACELPFDQWTHRAHLKVAYLYIREHGLDAAIPRLRTGIRAYNAKNNVPDSPTSGYNETTTCAFARIIAAMISAYGETFPTATADEFCETHPQLMSRHILRLFYSPQRRMHADAKQMFIEPDLAQLPRIL